MKVTFDDINEVISEGAKIETENFQYALKRIKNQHKKYFKKYLDNLEDLRIDLCSVDEKGNVLKDDKGSYVFSKENLKTLTIKARQLQEFEIEPYFATDFPELTEDQKELFAGILIAE